jgi:hypothetical protein
VPALRFRLIATAVILAIVAGLAAIEIHGVLSDASQQRGVITVVDCFFANEDTHSQSTYDCSGTFVADSGSIGHGIGLDFVSFAHDGDLAAGAKVVARVSGPDDKSATEVSESRYRLYLIVGFIILLLWPLIIMWYRAALAGGSVRPAPARGGPSAPS